MVNAHDANKVFPDEEYTYILLPITDGNSVGQSSVIRKNASGPDNSYVC